MDSPHDLKHQRNSRRVKGEACAKHQEASDIMEAETRYFIVEGKRLTEDEYYDLPVATRARYWLAGTRQLAGWLGYWRDCRLPACRRAKACRGEVRPEDGVEERDTAFPPCAHGNERRRNQIINTGIEMNRQAAQAAAKKA